MSLAPPCLSATSCENGAPMFPVAVALRPRPRSACVSNSVNVIFPFNVSGCANVASRNNAGTTVPSSGYAQTNVSPANPNAIEVRTKNKDGGAEDADFHLIVICP